MKMFEKIMQHMDLFAALTQASHSLLAAAKNKRVKLVDEIAENRERLLNIIKTLQGSIEDDIAALKPGTVTKEEVDIIKTWGQEVGTFVMINDNLDRECMVLLEEQKEETTKEIATVFTNRQSFKGYNLSSVKK